MTLDLKQKRKTKYLKLKIQKHEKTKTEKDEKLVLPKEYVGNANLYNPY